MVAVRPQGGEGELPLYFADPGQAAAHTGLPTPGFKDLWGAFCSHVTFVAQSGPTPAETPIVPRGLDLSARFSCAIELPAAALPAVVCQWWTACARDGTATVDRRLRLGPPSGQCGDVWSMRGRFKRPLHWHGVPVVVELSPIYGSWTRMNLTPQVRVLRSRRYFRIGHMLLDRLTGALIETWLRSPGTADGASRPGPADGLGAGPLPWRGESTS